MSLVYDRAMLPDRLPRPSEDVVFRQLNDEVVLVHLKTNQIYALNPTAARFWQLLDEGLDAAAIRRTLTAEFDVEDAVVDREMAAMLRSLAAERLVRDL